MKRIAAKALRRLKKASNRKVVPLAEVREARASAEALHREMEQRQAQFGGRMDPGFLMASEAQNLVTLLAEHLISLPELSRHLAFLEQIQEQYIPGLPPYSSVTETFSQTLAMFDVGFGVDRESLGEILLAMAATLKLPEHARHYLQDMCANHMGIYEQVGEAQSGHVQLRDLVTGEQYLAHDINDYRGSPGELWLVRLLPDHYVRPDRSLMVTTPYILRSGVESWRAFLERQGVHDAATYRTLMKPGPSREFWLEFAHQAYSGVAEGTAAIYLSGVPDVAASRPHPSELYGDRLPESAGFVSPAPGVPAGLGPSRGGPSDIRPSPNGPSAPNRTASPAKAAGASAPRVECSCGSGKYHAHCCALPSLSDPREFITAQLGRLGPAASLEEMNARVAEQQSAHNTTPVREFCGLSPETMHKLLNHPFESPEVLHFDVTKSPEYGSVWMMNATRLLMLLQEKPARATGKGNLPLSVCKQLVAAEAVDMPPDIAAHMLRFRSEEDVEDLHIARVIAEAGELIELRKGYFHVTETAERLLARGDDGAALYFALFLSATRAYNWAYGDGGDELHIIQLAALFSLYLLSVYGEEMRPANFYSNLVGDAFSDIGQRGDRQAAQICYELRTFVRWAWPLGLCEIDMRPRVGGGLQLLVKKTDFLDQFVRFSP